MDLKLHLIVILKPIKILNFLPGGKQPMRNFPNEKNFTLFPTLNPFSRLFLKNNGKKWEKNKKNRNFFSYESCFPPVFFYKKFEKGKN